MDPVHASTHTGTSLGLLFRQVRDAIWSAMAQELAAVGEELTFSQFVTIKRLGCDDAGPQGVTDLARAAELNPGAMTRLLDQLEKRGLVSRHADPGDRRALRIQLTAQGRAMHGVLVGCSDRVRARALSGMSELDAGRLVRLLEQVRGNLTGDGA